MLLGSAFEIAGAVLLGREVAKTISKGIINTDAYEDNAPVRGCACLLGALTIHTLFFCGANTFGPLGHTVPLQLFAMAMLCVLFGSGLAVWLATFKALPISASHGIIGGLLGVGIAAKGWGSIGVRSLSLICFVATHSAMHVGAPVVLQRYCLLRVAYCAIPDS